MLLEAATFSLVNVGIGFVLSWLLAHYVLPLFFGRQERSVKRSTVITGIYTFVALVRNVAVYWGFTNV